jgi:hypothetical protein
MKCPQRGLEMVSGVTVVKSKSGWLSMFAGINGYQHLWFVAVDPSNHEAVRNATISDDGELLQKAYQAGAAFRCNQCRTAVLMQSKPSLADSK